MATLKKKELRDTFCSFLAHFGANDSQVARKLRVTIQASQPKPRLNNVNAIRGGIMASAKLYLDTRSSVGLTAPVKVVITHNRRSAYLSLGIKAPIEKWDPHLLCLKVK